MTRERPKVVKRDGAWKIQRPPFGFGGKPILTGHFSSQRAAFTAALRFVVTSTATATVARAGSPEPAGRWARGWNRRWQPVIGQEEAS